MFQLSKRYKKLIELATFVIALNFMYLFVAIVQDDDVT